MYTNLNSITNKLDQLLIEVTRLHPTIIVATETWLKELHPDCMVALPGYNLLRRDRLRTDYDRGGSVIIYFVRQVQGIKTQASILQDLMSPLVEALWIRVTLNDLVLTIGGVYCLPPQMAPSLPRPILPCSVPSTRWHSPQTRW